MIAVGKPVISVRPFAVDDHQHVAKLFHDVITTRFDPSSEFYTPWGEYTQKRLQSDMGNIHDAYIAAGGNFWVAVASFCDADGTQEERIAGIIGLERKSEGEGEVRSVFVDPDYHRLGIGRALVTHLTDWARDHGFTRVFLTTMARNTVPRAFYESLGFVYEPQPTPITLFDGRIEFAKYAKQL